MSSKQQASKAANAVEKLRERNQRWAKSAKRAQFSGNKSQQSGSWKRETFNLPRDEAREKARAFLKKYPKAAYWSEVETWRVLPDDHIEFTMRRLPSAD